MFLFAELCIILMIRGKTREEAEAFATVVLNNFYLEEDIGKDRDIEAA